MAKNFFASIMASQDVASLLYSGVYFEGTEAKEIHDGALVVKGDLMDHSIYTGIKDYNTYKITAPVADTDSVDIVDVSTRSHGEIMGVDYREGIKTFGLTGKAGVPVRVRVMGKGDKFFIAKDNFASAPTVGKFAIPTAGSTLLTPADAAATDKTSFKIHFKEDVIEGMVNTDEEYFVEVVKAI